MLRPFQKDKNREKKTAELTAVGRAFGHEDPDLVIRNPDYLAQKFLSMPWKIAKTPLFRKLVMKLYEKKLPGQYIFAQVRTLFFDEILQQELEQGIEQLVILGAGFDSRAHRFEQALKNVKVFEVDSVVENGFIAPGNLIDIF